MNRVAGAALSAAVLLAPATASAQASDAWQFGASIYGWLPSLTGTTTFPVPPGGSGATVDADIIDSIKLVLMGSFEARKGRWGGFTDVVYLDLGNSTTQTGHFQLGRLQVPADVTGEFTYRLKSTIWTLAGEYRAVAEDNVHVDAFLGGRMVDLRQTLSYALGGNVGPIALPDRAGASEAKLNNVDAIVGVKGRYSFGDERRWFVPFYGDVGTGESKSTYQVMTGLGYAFKWGEIVGQYRYLTYKFDGPIESLSLSGPAVVLNFRW
ncbi:MAG TPA: hypothetical protein VLD35_19435 [Caldimonas sp.]|nr:hypothetical protein [Caldimonas sp.]